MTGMPSTLNNSYAAIVGITANLAGQQGEGFPPPGIRHGGGDAGAAVDRHPMAAHGVGQGDKIRGAECHAQRLKATLPLFLLDQGKGVVHEHHNQDILPQIPQGGQFAHDHFQAGIAHETDHHAVGGRQFGADGQGQGATHGA